MNPKEGAIAFPIYLQIVKGSTAEQIRVAEEVVNELLTPENNSRYAKLTHNIPVRGAGMAQRVDEALNPKVIESAIWLDWATMGQKSSEWRQREKRSSRAWVSGAGVEVRGHEALRRGRRRRRRLVRRPARRVLLAPRPVRLREDDDPPRDRRLRARRCGRGPDRRPADGPAAAEPPGDQHGLPAAGPVPPLHRPRQRRVRSPDEAAPRARRPETSRPTPSSWCACRGWPPAGSASCRAASSSGSRSRGRSSTVPGSSSSTSR